jgi:hypothetical protein
VKPFVRRTLCAVLAALPALALADRATGGNTAAADLDFRIDIGKFLFFRIGNSAYPTDNATPNTVTFNAVPTIPAGAVVPVPGNNTTVNWSGALPAFSTTATTLPVEVRSNAGQVSIRATVTTPLTSGANGIPMSQIVLNSSDPSLPAPVVPNAGTGAAVTVAGTAFGNLVTARSANWTFSYNPVITQRAGNYSGQISFTASSP